MSRPFLVSHVRKTSLLSGSGQIRRAKELLVKRSLLLRYGAAVLVVALALLLDFLLTPLIVQDLSFLLGLVAVLIVALFGGLGPGLLASAIAALALDYFFLPPLDSFSGLEVEKSTSLGLFVLEAVLVTATAAVLRPASRRAGLYTAETHGRWESRIIQGEEFFENHPPVLRYSVAVLVVALVLLVKLALDPLIGTPTPFLMGLFAVVIAALFGGLGPGLLATILIGLGIDYLFLPPLGTIGGPVLQAMPVVLLLVEGAVVSAIASAMRSARLQAETNAREAQRRREKLQESEERFRLLVQGVKDYAIFMLDPDGYVVSWNEGAKRMKGYTEEEIIGEHFSRFYTDEEVERGLPKEALRIAVDEDQHQVEGLRVRKDGSRFWADVLITPLRDEDESLRGFSKVTRDITERRRAEHRLRDALDRLLVLYETGQGLNSSLKQEEIGQRLLENLQRVCHISAGIVNRQDEEGRWRVLCTAGPENLLYEARSTSEAQDAWRAMLRAEEPQSFELRSSVPDGTPLWGLYLPLRVRERLVGALETYGPQALQGRETITTFASLAVQAASALENARLYEELAERERRLRDLVGRILVAQEEERHHISYEVHDGLAQIAAAAHQRLQVFARRHPPGSARGQRELDRALELMQQAVKEARHIIAGLRPTALDDFGLATALRLQAEELGAEELEVSYEEALGGERLPAMVETALYRVAQEALTNVRKHAHSHRADIKLERLDQTVRLEVRDWGEGFEEEELAGGGGPGERVGLTSMHERVALLGGELRVHSQPGVGTSVVAEVPLPDGEDSDIEAGDDGR